MSNTLEFNRDVLVLTLSGEVLKAKIPRGDIGPPGRDGMNIRGDQGPAGIKGDNGRDGRDSIVPGPKGDVGDTGAKGLPIKLTMGSVNHGENGNAIISKSNVDDLLYELHLTLPRGFIGNTGLTGRDGKHGSHEVAQVLSIGHNPRYTVELLSKHIIADGIIEMPAMTEADYGKWMMFKTFDRLVCNNCVEGYVAIEKNQSAKLIVVQYQNKYMFTKF